MSWKSQKIDMRQYVMRPMICKYFTVNWVFLDFKHHLYEMSQNQMYKNVLQIICLQ